MIITQWRLGIRKDSIFKEISFNNIDDINNIGNIIGTEYEFATINKGIDYDFKWLGGNLLDIDLEESEILQNSEFTIAAKVKLSQSEQNAISSMGILGNHTDKSGIVWQFLNRSNILQFGITTSSDMVNVDYTDYYDKYTDIVMTYKDKVITVYIDGIRYNSLESATMIANGKIYIGCSYANTNRGMIGYLPYIKIWNKALTQEEVSKLNLEEINTKIEKDNIIREIRLKTPSDITSSGSFRNNSYKITMKGK